MRKNIILSVISTLMMISFMGCSQNDEKVVENKIETVDLYKFTDKELSQFKKSYKELELSEYSYLEKKYWDVSDEERGKVKEELDRLKKEKSEVDKQSDGNIQESKPTTASRENIIGTSNKDFKDIYDSKPRSVINDSTGNWKLSRIATSENVIDYVSSYYKSSFTDSKEVHAIVNFTLNTTTKVSKLSDSILSVTVYEYVNKEELDAKKLFTGMVLGEYWIYLDNGDIEEIK